MDVQNAHKRIDGIEKQVNSHGEQIKALSMSLKENTDSLHENTMLTKQIADNTEEMVFLIKGSKVFSRLFLTVASIAGALYGLYSWVIGK